MNKLLTQAGAWGTRVISFRTDELWPFAIVSWLSLLDHRPFFQAGGEDIDEIQGQVPKDQARERNDSNNRFSEGLHEVHEGLRQFDQCPSRHFTDKEELVN